MGMLPMPGQARSSHAGPRPGLLDFGETHALPRRTPASPAMPRLASAGLALFDFVWYFPCQTKPTLARPCRAKPRLALLDLVNPLPCPTWACRARPRQARPYLALLDLVETHALPCRAKPRLAAPRHAMRNHAAACPSSSSARQETPAASRAEMD